MSEILGYCYRWHPITAEEIIRIPGTLNAITSGKDPVTLQSVSGKMQEYACKFCYQISTRATN